MLALVLVLGWYGGWWEGLVRPVVNSKTLPSKPAVPSIDLYQTKLVGWDQQQKAWEIRAKRIWQSADGNITYFNQIDQGIIFSVEGRTAYFKAGWARWEKPRSVLYIGGFLNITVDQHRFKTKEAVMWFKNQELSCSYPIEVIGKDVRLKAEKLKVNLKRKDVRLEGNVVLSQGRDQITSQTVIYNLKSKQYQLLEPGGIILNL